MAANLVKVLATVFALAVVFGDDVSAETRHHVVLGGEENGQISDAGMGSWLSGRVFRVGDKLWFNIGNGKDNIVELQSPEQLLSSCYLRNTIRLFTDQLVLEKCIKGLRIPESIEPFRAKPEPLEPPMEPEPNPIHSPVRPNPEPKPKRPVCPPPPSPSPAPPPPPTSPSPAPPPPPPPPPPPSKPSVAVNLKGSSLALLFAGLVACYMTGP